MVRKKAVRKDSSKSVHKTDKKKALKHDTQVNVHHSRHRHHKIIRSLVKAKAEHLKTIRTEETPIDAGVERSKALVPVKAEPKVEEPKIQEQAAEETAPIEMPKPAPQEVTDKAIVPPDTDSIFADDPKVETPTVKEKGNGKGTKMIFAVIASVILLFWIILISASIVTNVDRTVERNTTVTTIEPITTNYSRYAQATGALDVLDTSLLGYLSEEIVSEDRAAANQTLFYLVDDYGNKIKLVMSGPEVAAHDLKFKAGTTSTYTYNVTGTFKYDAFNKLKYTFDVDNIVRQDRPTHTVQKEKIENVTITGKGFRIDITVGWEKLIGKK